MDVPETTNPALWREALETMTAFSGDTHNVGKRESRQKLSKPSACYKELRLWGEKSRGRWIKVEGLKKTKKNQRFGSWPFERTFNQESISIESKGGGSE